MGHFLQSLEQRRHLSAALQGNHLHVRGSTGDDVIVVTLEKKQLVVHEGDKVHRFARPRNLWVQIDARGGDDHITISRLNVNTYITGGQGNDTIVGGAGEDLIHGNQGRDRLEGRAGKDQLIGGAGLDTCLGGDGDDILVHPNKKNVKPDKLVGGRGNNYTFKSPVHRLLPPIESAGAGTLLIEPGTAGVLTLVGGGVLTVQTTNTNATLTRDATLDLSGTAGLIRGSLQFNAGSYIPTNDRQAGTATLIFHDISQTDVLIRYVQLAPQDIGSVESLPDSTPTDPPTDAPAEPEICPEPPAEPPVEEAAPPAITAEDEVLPLPLD